MNGFPFLKNLIVILLKPRQKFNNGTNVNLFSELQNILQNLFYKPAGKF